jgi:hypothetical protein
MKKFKKLLEDVWPIDVASAGKSYNNSVITDNPILDPTKFVQKFMNAGKSEGKDLPVDELELSMGIQVEYEHTNDMEIARKIAMDHLVEIHDYYTRLAKMEKAAKKNNLTRPDKVEQIAIANQIHFKNDDSDEDVDI